MLPFLQSAGGKIVADITDSSFLRLDGILFHSGHAYHVVSADAAADVAEKERAVMVGFAERLRSTGIDVTTVSVCSTPAMRAVRGSEVVNHWKI